MHINHNDDLCVQMGLNGRSQMRDTPCLRNLWWTFEGSMVAFGFGDLDESDYERIQAYLMHPSHEADIVFVGWHENHGTAMEMTVYSMVRITKDEVTYPHRVAIGKWLTVVK